MAFPLTPHILKQAYDLLSTTEPFSRWNLPDSDDVVFKVRRGRSASATLLAERGKTVIGISTACNGHINTVLSSMAHEMVHLHEYRCKIRARGPDHHGGAFRKWAAQVCEAHGYDLKLFY